VTSKKAAPLADNLFPVVSRIGLRQDVINLFRELTVSWNERQRGYMLKTRALFMLILHRLREIIVHDVDSARGDYRINRITRYIGAHYTEKLTVKALARQVNLDEVYFGHLFKTETGMTVHQYMTRVRVHNAENLLQSGGYKIHEAAELCGFSDIFHFYKAFKALRGFPPSRCIPRR
jgi:AraC-like DNA-binding protein